MSDAINPAHYKRLPAEAIEIIESAIDKAPSNQNAYLHGQVLKYILRCWSKNGIEDLKKAKWYLDRLIDAFDESIAEANETPIEPTRPSKTQPPAGYRLLGPAKDEPRIEGDSYWSLAIKGWTVLTSHKVEYANRDNWAACRKIEPVVKQSLTPDPPDGWRWIDRGEVIREGDRYFSGDQWKDRDWAIGETYSPIHQKTIRRNRFEVGEKVVRVSNGVVYKVIRILSMGYQLESEFCAEVILHAKDLAPYIEETK